MLWFLQFLYTVAAEEPKSKRILEGKCVSLSFTVELLFVKSNITALLGAAKSDYRCLKKNTNSNSQSLSLVFCPFVF